MAADQSGHPETNRDGRVTITSVKDGIAVTSRGKPSAPSFSRAHTALQRRKQTLEAQISPLRSGYVLPRPAASALTTLLET